MTQATTSMQDNAEFLSRLGRYCDSNASLVEKAQNALSSHHMSKPKPTNRRSVATEAANLRDLFPYHRSMRHEFIKEQEQLQERDRWALEAMRDSEARPPLTQRRTGRRPSKPASSARPPPSSPAPASRSTRRPYLPRRNSYNRLNKTCRWQDNITRSTGL
ncbi:MAG: hypothetical protein P4M11_13890 [Candidatus Pacebacteria bacterium]|nr:hypothetical protein [Candidatus Paceibacterota bacterium]